MEIVGLYCERLGPGLLAEPVNAATNAAFFIAAWALGRAWRHRDTGSLGVLFLITLIVAIGIGSSLFHTFATTWARILDEGTILVFQLAFMWLYARRVIAWRSGWATALMLAFFVVALFSRQFSHLLNGSLIYLPAIVTLVALGLYHWLTRKPEPLLLIVGSGALVVGVFFRTIDTAICSYFPLGTHFLWHLAVSIVLYMCVRALKASLPIATMPRRIQ